METCRGESHRSYFGCSPEKWSVWRDTHWHQGSYHQDRQSGARHSREKCGVPPCPHTYKPSHAALGGTESPSCWLQALPMGKVTCKPLREAVWGSSVSKLGCSDPGPLLSPILLNPISLTLGNSHFQAKPSLFAKCAVKYWGKCSKWTTYLSFWSKW